MPLGEGPLGSPDWQKVQNWDGPALNYGFRKASAPFTVGPFNVSRYGYLAGQLGLGTGATGQALFKWAIDEAFTESLGFRDLTLSNQFADFANLRLLNLGPFVEVELIPEEGVLTGFTTRLIATNRAHPLELIPFKPVLLVAEHTFAGAGSVFLYPESYYGGPARLFLKPEAAGETFVHLEALDSPGTWAIADFASAAASAVATPELVIPPGGWRLNLFSAAAQNVQVTVTAFMSGSS